MDNGCIIIFTIIGTRLNEVLAILFGHMLQANLNLCKKYVCLGKAEVLGVLL